MRYAFFNSYPTDYKYFQCKCAASGDVYCIITQLAIYVIREHFTITTLFADFSINISGFVFGIVCVQGTDYAHIFENKVYDETDHDESQHDHFYRTLKHQELDISKLYEYHAETGSPERPQSPENPPKTLLF